MTKIVAFELSQPVSSLSYRCYLLDKTGRFTDTKIFSARDDKEAAEYAFALFIRASSVYERFEVWNKNALVHAYNREVAKSDERHQPRTQRLTPPEAFGYVWRVDEMKGRLDHPSLTLSPPLFAQRNAWIGALRRLTIAFVITVSWMMFDATLLRLPLPHSPVPSASTLISRLP